MPELDRTRDVVILKKGDGYAMTVSPSMAATTWAGGQGVQWFNTGSDELAVDFSDGLAHAFMLWGADEDSDQYTAMTRQQPVYQYGVVGFGGWVIAVRTFERFTLGSGRTVPIVYSAQDELFFSLTGLMTNEDEWTITADPRAPNENLVGVVIQPPSSLTNDFMTVQVKL